ncbi:Small glutamine-rich tetratricopeptide repeat-containing protein alpha [Pseudolycoriella hygida]|uniref:Small glutamine-rich tetratricopeptide repeat-containing protein alpha n=1 Tax=Pseudolycoriella hygida TaxID=35572 RepID=A0A9Q0RWG7_9DIPT|nr:Small glutamine-rich tetratricopeptide repeat-containing protein alpha [Pseudolycoriella hygida]
MSDLEAKYFVRSFLNFIQNQIAERNFSADIVESLEVAQQCLETAYDLPNGDPEGQASQSEFDENHPMAAVNLFELFQNSCIGVKISPERKLEAENIKNEGNCLMKEEKYQEALIAYSRAISLDATNPVFYCNRAAAYSRLGDYQKAADDCKMSLRYDPSYSKAYGRLGIAYSKLNNPKAALEAYQKAIDLDPDNVDYQNNMSVTKQRLEEMNNAPTTAPPNPLAGFPNIGNIDLSAAFNNPAFTNLAQRFMTDPTMHDMISSLQNNSSMESIFETGQQLVSQLQNQNPELFNSLRQQMSNVARGGTGDGNNPGTDGTPPNNQPPSH